MVVFNGHQSTRSVLDCGVSQESMFGPILFILYTSYVTAITKRHELGAISYADGTQLYAHLILNSGQLA